MIQSVVDLDFFNLSYAFAMKVFHESRLFPKEEKYSLIDQSVRAFRSIAEGFGKRSYENEFKNTLFMR